LFWAMASGIHSKKANADSSFVDSGTAFSRLNRLGIEISA